MAAPGDPYAPQAYWDDLLAEQLTERGVGYPNLAIAFNRAMYRSLTSNTSRLLDDAGIGVRARVLDVGAGTGIWVDFWRQRGVRELTGLDLTQAAVDYLAQRFPDFRFLRADIADEPPPLPAFDVITAMSVLLHITDDERFRRALRHLGGLLAPGGVLLLIEPAVVHRWWGPPFGPEANSKARPIGEWNAALAAADLTLEQIRPATAILSNAVDTRHAWSFQLHSLYWHALTRAMGTRERVGKMAGPLLLGVDRVLTRTMPSGPSAKLMLVRRVSADQSR